jgi:hypothetical protein
MKARSAYHIIAFDRSVNAAAFVAALSRFINSPEGSSYQARPSAIEVWGHTLANDEKVEIYLSDAALEAATARFAPVPVISSLGAHELPEDCLLIFGGREIPSLGLAEARRIPGVQDNAPIE